MRKILLILIILSVVLYSCGFGGGFDPRAYNKRSSSQLDELPSEEGTDIPDIPKGDDPFLNIDYSNPDKHYSATKFDEWNFRITIIDGKNVPWYIFDTTGGSKWAPGDSTKAETTYGGGNITAQGFGVKNMRYYRYESKNPTFTGDSSYNTGAHGERMERFRFYKFTGTAPAGPALDNYTIAVDTYNKLIFAFAVPIRFQNVFGNQVPTGWGSIDNNYEMKVDESTVKYPFYEYDPIGYVNEEGEVTIHQWFINILGSGKSNPVIDKQFQPNEDGEGGRIAEMGETRGGRSPYFRVGAAGTVVDPFLKGIGGKTYSLRYTDGNIDMDTLTLHSYTFDASSGAVTYTTKKWFTGVETTELDNIEYDSANKIDQSTGKYANDDTFKVTGNKLYRNGEFVGIQDYNSEPDFLDRVKGATFSDGSNYEFTDNGRRVVINGSTYHYEKSRDGATGLYGWENSIGIWFFYSVKLYDDDGKKDHKIQRGSSGGGKDAPVWDPFMTDTGYRTTDPLPPPTDLFLKAVAGKTYSLRDATDTTILNKYVFTSDGKTVTYRTHVWNGAESTKNTFDVYTEVNDTTGSYSSTTFRVDGNKLYKGSAHAHVGTYLYDDPEPEFKDLQKGKTYSLRLNGSTEILHKYQFSSDGNTITYTTQNWLENEVATIEVFSGYDGTDADADNARYGGVLFNVKDDVRLFKGVTHIGTLNYNDPEPDFLDRVKGATFGDGSNYEFTDNGRSVVINDDTYHYEKSRDGVTGLYWWKNWFGIYYFYPVKLSNYDGKKDQKIQRGSTGGGKDAPVWNVFMTDTAYRK